MVMGWAPPSLISSGCDNKMLEKKNYGDELLDASWMLVTIMPDGGSRFGSAQGSKGVLGPTHLLDCCDLWDKLGGYLLQS